MMQTCCGYWGGPWGSFAWILPVVGLLFMAVMAYVCFRGMRGCMLGPGFRMGGDNERLQAEVRALREEIDKLRQRG